MTDAYAGLADLIQERGPDLLSTATLLAGGRHAGEDLLQGALERTMRAWRRIEGDREGYLRRTMYHLAVDGWRRRKRRPEVLASVEPPAQPDAADAIALRHMLAEALATLTPKQRAMLILRYFEQLSEAEAAEVLGCSVGTVKSTTSRGLAKLREYAIATAPSPDILDRAVRANRRRAAGLAAIGTSIAVVAVLAAVFVSARTPHEPPAPAASPSASASPTPLAAAEVTQRAIAVLSATDVEHVRLTEVHDDGITTAEQHWYDPVANDHRMLIDRPRPGEHRIEMWQLETGGRSTAYVDHTARTWYTDSGGDPLGTKMPYLPQAVRTQLGAAGFAMLGTEAVSGRTAYHLVWSIPERKDEIWIDAGTFQVVRRQIAQLQLAINFTVTMDFDWQPRTPDSVRPLQFTPPPGYRRVQPS